MIGEKHEQGVFKARLEVGLLRGYVFGLSTLVDECWIDCDKKGLETKVVDPAHVAMMEMFIPVGVLENYRCTTSGRVGIDLDRLAKELVNMKDRDTITLEIIEETHKDTGMPTYFLKLQYGSYTRVMRCVDTTGMSEPKVPGLSLPVNFTTSFKRIQKIVSRLNNISDHVRICWVTDGVTFEAEGYDGEKASFKYPRDLLDGHENIEIIKKNVTLEKTKECRSLFPLDYFSNPFKKSGRSGFRHWFNKQEWLGLITFTMGDDYPIIMEAERDGLKWRYLLAPRIESE